MQEYVRNPRCSCARCRSNGLMGAAVVITLGVLFLLSENDVVQFGNSWPVLFLVIGAFIFLGQTASTENHIQPYQAPPAANLPTHAQPTWYPGATPPPPPPSSQSGPQVQSGTQVDDQQVKQ